MNSVVREETELSGCIKEQDGTDIMRKIPMILEFRTSLCLNTPKDSAVQIAFGTHKKAPRAANGFPLLRFL
jgi:hypothetical protein